MWERRFVVESGEGVPVGVMPRLLIYLHSLGSTTCRWLDGCIVRVREGEREMRVRVWRSREVNVEVRSESSEGCSEEVLSMAARVLRGLNAAVSNLLSEFYRLEWHQEVKTGEGWTSFGRIQKAVVGGEEEIEGRRIDAIAPEAQFKDVKRSDRQFLFAADQLEAGEVVGQ